MCVALMLWGEWGACADSLHDSLIRKCPRIRKLIVQVYNLCKFLHAKFYELLPKVKAFKGWNFFFIFMIERNF